MLSTYSRWPGPFELFLFDFPRAGSLSVGSQLSSPYCYSITAKYSYPQISIWYFYYDLKGHYHNDVAMILVEFQFLMLFIVTHKQPTYQGTEFCICIRRHFFFFTPALVVIGLMCDHVWWSTSLDFRIQKCLTEKLKTLWNVIRNLQKSLGTVGSSSKILLLPKEKSHPCAVKKLAEEASACGNFHQLQTALSIPLIIAPDPSLFLRHLYKSLLLSTER